MLLKSFTFVCLLLITSTRAEDTATPKLPGIALSTRLADEFGQYVFHNALDYSALSGTLDAEQLVFFAKASYEDISKVFDKYKNNYDDLDKPESVAVLAKDDDIYVSSTLSRNTTAGAWNPHIFNDPIRDALYQCQARILAGVGDKTPGNCVEAMVMHIYLASHPESGASVEGAKLAVWGKTGDGKAGLLEPCAPDRTNNVAFANAYGCSNLLQAMKVESIPADTDWGQGREHHIKDVMAAKVCL